MAKSKKDNLVRLVSTAGTGYSIVRKKAAKKTEKMKLKKYDPFVRKHVEFEEKKLPNPKAK
jgi:large subunit ribosomal protein L33